jgi:protein involved in polysaccharide export with SLBB domain
MEMIRSKWLLIFFLFAGFAMQGQELFYRKNLADIDIEKLSPSELSRFQKQMASTNMSERELSRYLMEKGLSRSDISKLMRQLDRAQSRSDRSSFEKEDDIDDFTTKEDSLLERMYLQSRKFPDSLIFGSEIFNNSSLNFTPIIQLATPVNYIVGPGDELNVTLYGNQEVSTDIKVTPNGNITIPYAGVVYVSGITIDQAEDKIKKALKANGYEALSTGGTRLTVTVKSYRSFNVTVIGAKYPGNYKVPSVASAFYALHMAGGPLPRGTYRDIEVIRKGKIIQRIDLYKFMVYGDQTGDITLEENDIINIPAYNRRIRLKGEVKRPGFFELTEGESLDTLLFYAGGFNPIAYKENIYVERVGKNEFITKDIQKGAFGSYMPESGDIIVVGSIMNRYINRVHVAGAINRPGKYGWDEGMMLSDLFHKAGGLRENALMSRGIIYRSSRAHKNSYLRFSPGEVMAGASDLSLEDGDSIVLGDRSKMFPYEFVSVVGEVNKSDKFTYGEGMTALDAILLAGGMKRSAMSSRIEITRKKENSNDMEIATIIEGVSDAELAIRAEEVELQPMDIVIVKPKPDYKDQQVVSVEGEVLYPGSFVLLKRRERLSSVIQRAGGLTPLGDENAVYIIRQRANPFFNRELKKLGLEDESSYVSADSLRRNKIGRRDEWDFRNADSRGKSPADTLDIFGRGASPKMQRPDSILIDTIAVNNVLALMKDPGGKYDLHLREDDRVVVQMRDYTVSVKGSVNNKVTVNYSGGSLKSYLNDAGGTQKNADNKRIFVI